MTHLGSWLSALADGQLPADVTERCLAHVATCPRCAGELSAARAAHRALAAAVAAEALEPGPDLTARLLSLAPTSAPRPAAPYIDPFAPTTSLPSSGALRGDVHPVHPVRRQAGRLVIGSFAGLGIVAAVLFALGARPVVVPSAHPGLALGVLGEAAAAVPRAEPVAFEQVAAFASDGWAVPEMPDEWTVMDARAVDGGIEVDLVGPSGTAVVGERRGRLDVDALAGHPMARVGGRDVYLISAEPWHVAWQCDDTVVEVLAPAADGDLEALVAAFPAEPFDDGVPARIGRGWSVVAHAFEMP